jgi:hypothetical protein
MIFTISEIYCEAIRPDTTFEQSDIKLQMSTFILTLKLVLPKLFSTATQFLERQSIATRIALLDKKKSSSKKKIFLFIIEYNSTAYIMCLICYPFLILFCFFTFPFLMIFNFYINKNITFQKLFATHHKSARDPPVWEMLT